MSHRLKIESVAGGDACGVKLEDDQFEYSTDHDGNNIFFPDACPSSGLSIKRECKSFDCSTVGEEESKPEEDGSFTIDSWEQDAMRSAEAAKKSCVSPSKVPDDNIFVCPSETIVCVGTPPVTDVGGLKTEGVTAEEYEEFGHKEDLDSPRYADSAKCTKEISTLQMSDGLHCHPGQEAMSVSTGLKSDFLYKSPRHDISGRSVVDPFLAARSVDYLHSSCCNPFVSEESNNSHCKAGKSAGENHDSTVLSSRGIGCEGESQPKLLPAVKDQNESSQSVSTDPIGYIFGGKKELARPTQYTNVESFDRLSHNERENDVKTAIAIAHARAVSASQCINVENVGKLLCSDSYWKCDGQWKDDLHRGQFESRPANKFPYTHGKPMQKMWAAFEHRKLMKVKHGGKFLPSPYMDPEIYETLSIADRAIAVLNFSMSDVDSSDSDISVCDEQYAEEMDS